MSCYSLSEYGCIKSTRTFSEVAALYSSQMTPVYSGGLVYEYSEESSNPGYGLVTIDSNTQVTELPDFASLKTAFAGTSNPSGDGGYSANGTASTCPPQSAAWNVTSDALPAIPDAAKKYMTQGAGTGPGLSGAGSQDAGAGSTGTASAGSGSATATASTSSSTSTHKGAAGTLRASDFSFAPFSCGLVIVVSTLLGAALL